MKRGLFVVLEGLDGAGTTTQTEALAKALRARKQAVHCTREPSDGPIGTLIRQALSGRLRLASNQSLTAETLALLFAADRADHLASEVEPALARGQLVLSDRYLLSSLAYQGADLAMHWVEAINQVAVAPDLTLFLEVPVKLGAQRRKQRGGEAELYDAHSSQEKIAAQYKKAIGLRRSKERIVVIDGTRRIEEITEQALNEVLALGRR